MTELRSRWTNLTAVILFGGLVVCPLLAQDPDHRKEVQAIAAELQKGNAGKAKQLAGALTKRIDGISDVMNVPKPAKNGGLGGDDGHVLAAVAEVTLLMPPAKNQNAWNGRAQYLRILGLALANANPAQKPKIADNIRNVCNACHMQFK